MRQPNQCHKKVGKPCRLVFAGERWQFGRHRPVAKVRPKEDFKVLRCLDCRFTFVPITGEVL